MREVATLGNVQVQVQVLIKKRQSRADRLDEAIHFVETGAEALRDAVQVAAGDSEEVSDAKQNVCDALDEIMDAVEELRGVEFPGMFG